MRNLNRLILLVPATNSDVTILDLSFSIISTTCFLLGGFSPTTIFTNIVYLVSISDGKSGLLADNRQKLLWSIWESNPSAAGAKPAGGQPECP